MKVLVGKEFMINEHSYEHITIRLIAYICELVSFSDTLTDHDKSEWACVSDLASLKLAPADVPIAEALVGLN